MTILNLLTAAATQLPQLQRLYQSYTQKQTAPTSPPQVNTQTTPQVTQPTTTQPVKRTASGSLDRPTNTEVNPYFFSYNGSPTKQSTLQNVAPVVGWDTSFDGKAVTVQKTNPGLWDVPVKIQNGGGQNIGFGGVDKASGSNIVTDINAVQKAMVSPYKNQFDEDAETARMAAEKKRAEDEARRKALLDQGLLDLDSEAALVERKTQQASNNLARLLEQRKGEYFNKRNEADTQKFMMLKRLQEEAAANGLYFDSQTGTNALQAQLISENTKNALDQDEQNYISDITNQLADLDQNSAADLQSIYAKKRLANESYGREGLAAKESSNAALESKLTELQRMYLDRKRSDFESDRTFDYNAQQDTLDRERQTRLDKIAAEESDLQKQSTQLAIEEQQIKLAYLKDPNSPENQARLLDLEEKKQAVEYRKAQIASEKAQAASSYALAAKRSSGGSSSGSSSSGKATIKDTIDDMKKYNYSVADMKANLEANRQNYINLFGESGYKRIWNDVLGYAISKGQAAQMK